MGIDGNNSKVSNNRVPDTSRRETLKKGVGISAFIVGLAMAAISALLAVGIFGGGAYYYSAGALAIGSIPLFLLSTYFLCQIKTRRDPKMEQPPIVLE